MPEQSRLFRLSPTHLYVAAHWTPGGWSVVVTATTATQHGHERHQDSYDHLLAPELVDVVSAELAKQLEV